MDLTKWLLHTLAVSDKRAPASGLDHRVGILTHQINNTIDVIHQLRCHKKKAPFGKLLAKFQSFDLFPSLNIRTFIKNIFYL